MFPRLLVSTPNNHSEEWRYPSRKTSGAAGYDLQSEILLKSCEPDRLYSIPTGYAISGNKTTCLWKIAERSGMAYKHGMFIQNSIITDDTITIPLFNGGNKMFTINIGDRIAQLLTVKCFNIALVFNDGLSRPKQA